MPTNISHSSRDYARSSSNLVSFSGSSCQSDIKLKRLCLEFLLAHGLPTKSMLVMLMQDLTSIWQQSNDPQDSLKRYQVVLLVYF